MRSQLARTLKRTAQDTARQTMEAIAPNVDTALHNEIVTRQRVEVLEVQVAKLITYQTHLVYWHEDFARSDGFEVLRRHFLGRLRWLLLGR